MQANVFSLLVTNRFGVLTKVTTLFGRRGCNINSLAVDIAHNPEMSRITVTVLEPEHKVDQIYKQLQKLEDVKNVTLFREGEFIEREIMLLETKSDKDLRVFGIYENEALHINRLSADKPLYEVIGTSRLITELILKLGQSNIETLSRSGSAAIKI